MKNDPVKHAASELAPHYGKSFGTLTASGMAAVELALELCGIRQSDEIIVPQETCFRVPAAVQRLGSQIVFAPTDFHTLDPNKLSALISDRTKAVIAVHHFGLPCRMREIRCNLPPHIKLIEDAAQALGLSSKGERVGQWSDYVVSSFSSSKPISLGGGGGVFGADASLVSAMEGHGNLCREAKTPPRPLKGTPFLRQQF